MKKHKKSDELLKASQALYYEIMMLNECPKRYIKLSQEKEVDSIIMNAIIESFCVHLRNLMEFFGKDQKDCITYKYFLTSTESIDFKHKLDNKYTQKVNNLLSHLTFKRLEYTLERKGWKIQVIANEVNENMMQFLSKANPDFICDTLKSMKFPTTDEDQATCTSSDYIGQPVLIQKASNK